jgi:hypothetical protein
MGGRRLSPRRSMAPRGANLPDVTRRAAPTLGISADLSRAAFARSRSRARAMDRPSQGRWAGPGMTGLLGTGPRAMPLRAAPGGSSGPQRVPPKTKRNAQPVLQTRPAGPAKWSLRLGRTCTQASPSAATTGEWSWPNHPCPRHALANGHERSTTAHADRP